MGWFDRGNGSIINCLLFIRSYLGEEKAWDAKFCRRINNKYIAVGNTYTVYNESVEKHALDDNNNY